MKGSSFGHKANPKTIQDGANDELGAGYSAYIQVGTEAGPHIYVVPDLHNLLQKSRMSKSLRMILIH